MMPQHVRLSRLAIAVGTGIFLISSVTLLFYGKLNMDASWYLYASNLVYRGMVPYRDFAFTQMPLLPYVYGIPQLLFGPSLLAGRATSLFFTCLSFFLALKVSHRYGGEVGAGITAIFLGTFFFGIYYLIIVKTYALVTFFFMLTFFLLSGHSSEPLRFSLAMMSMGLAVATRLSALPAALLILLYVVWAGSSINTRLLPLAGFLLVSAPVVLILITDLQAASWDLLTYHMLPWSNTTLTEKMVSIFLVRPLTFIFWLSPYLFYVLLAFLVGLLVSREPLFRRKFQAYIRRRHEILAIFAAMGLFIFSHLQTGTWYLEYFVPAVFVCLVILSIGCVKIYRRLGTQSGAQTITAGLIAVSLFIFAVPHLIPLLDVNDGRTVMNRMHQVSERVSSFTKPGDSLIVLEALWIAIESQRSPAAGYTMGQFSYLPFDHNNEARRLKMVNLHLVEEDIRRGQAKAVILTDLDWLTLSRENADRVCQALRENYFLMFTASQPGQERNKIHVYRLDDGSSLELDSFSGPCVRS